MSVPQWNADIITPEEEGSGTKVLDGNQVVQPTLEGGTNITISDGTISATGGGAEYYAGEGIVISNENAISITETVRDGAALGATSVQPADLSGYVLASSLAAVATSGDYDDLLDKPTIPNYTAGDGIDITANEVSVNAGTGLSFESAVTSTNLSAPAAQTGGSTFGHSLLGQLDAATVAALKAGTVTVKPLFAFKVQIDNGGVHFAICQKNGYNTPDRSGNWLVASDAVSSATSGTYTMTVGDSYTVDFSTLDAKSTTTWSTIEANPTAYYLQLISYETIMPLSAVTDYASVNIGASVPTEDVVTVEVGDPSASKTIVVSNPLPASAVGDADKVLTVNAQGTPAWATPATVTVDQSYNSASTNAQSGTAVAGALATVDEVPDVTSTDDGKVLKATYSGGVGSYAWATLALGGVQSIQQVNSLPANPDASTLYLIPEA